MISRPAKPLGPIPENFSVQEGELEIGGLRTRDIVELAGGTPLFAYSSALIERRVTTLRAAMPKRIALHYAVKANPYVPLLRLMAKLVDGFDIASAGELALLHEACVNPKQASFAGPGKRDDELTAAIKAGVTINLESEGEATRALALAERLHVQARLAIRVNPDFALQGGAMKMGGGPRPFGIDSHEVPALIRRIEASSAQWCGLHIFAGSQSLDWRALAQAQEQTLRLAARVSLDAGVALPRLNLGGGFGIPYANGQQELDVIALGAALSETLDHLPPELAQTLAQTNINLELGRWLVGTAGVYVTKVVERKVSQGEIFLITDGGLHHILAASGQLGMGIHRNYPVSIATRFDSAPDESASIVGCLCTPLDKIADHARFPKACAGDLVAVFCTGAYGASASPSAFLGHGPAREILI